ncbi:hypothetical protein KDW_23990 [Dictyobacter vulcani]|uniref:Penicillin-binding protein transpeptidase domain-containing protein n=1 Tax=Dictyobacter vulcani TaxID=2607529 RepID=A0A5J4KP82_9CHLR|nr:penicillin-binding transpeptidase domain-containing protein [Dictyobacter vulcani]GER88237.1 hypothetical protein KDW_23990 [Dictyobacter vulcani]
MRPYDDKVTADNIEQKIEQVFQAHGQAQPGASPDEQVLQELYQTLYYGDDGIMDRVWHRLAERYPLLEEQPAMTDARTVVKFPQPSTANPPRPTPKLAPRKPWRRNLSILLIVAACILLIGSSLFIFTQYQKPFQPATPHPKSPLQMFDRHGKLLYQVESNDKVTLGTTPVTRDFINYSLNELANDLHVQQTELGRMGLNVTTTLDTNLQMQSYQKAQQTIVTAKKEHNIDDAATVVLDYHDGSIRALYGSVSNQDPEFNAATQKGRPPASTFKPIDYITAFEQGISPGEVVNDVHQIFPINEGNIQGYAPYDNDRNELGLISYRHALQTNRNIPAVELVTRTGINALSRQAQALGLDEIANGYAMSLGTQDQTVLNTTVAYGTMANQGVHVASHTIELVKGADGRVLYQASQAGKRILKSGVAFMITDILSDQQAHTQNFEACNPVILYTASSQQCQAGQPGTIRPAAIQTGESDMARDNWTVGYTTDYVVGVWAGNQKYEPLRNVAATDGAGQIWHDTMQLAEQGLPIRQFPAAPADVVQKTMTYQGLTTTDWYLKDH